VVAKLITDEGEAQAIIANTNQEIHRLNYVTLTRAKARLYLYLKQPTINRKSNKYHALAKPEKLAELFGFVRDNSADSSHPLFDYPNLFNAPEQAIKRPDLLDGVRFCLGTVVNAALLTQLKPISQVNSNIASLATTVSVSSIGITPPRLNLSLETLIPFSRQSYTSLTHKLASTDLENNGNSGSESNNIVAIFDQDADCFVSEAVKVTKPFAIINYTNPLLNSMAGAKFGILVHSLCEHYPLTQAVATKLAASYNLNSDDIDYLMDLVDKIFNYPLIDKEVSLADIKSNVIKELEFNLTVGNAVDFKYILKQLLAKHYGELHPYTVATAGLNQIKPGFLHGFIDMVFYYQGKYYVLDYKTNSLSKYTNCCDAGDMNNPLVQENAKNHYYLQYIFYLVALKRSLQLWLNIADASSLLGGALYYYVRGIFVEDEAISGGVYIDDNCIELVRELDDTLSILR
jgi:ATP-dependent exoDNAse (exonuclease V) beta subunit